MSLRTLAASAPVACLAAIAPVRAQSPLAPSTFPDFGLTITFPPAFSDLAAAGKDDDSTLGAWEGKLGGKDLSIWLSDWSDSECTEPGEVASLLLDSYREAEDDPDPLFHFDELKLVPGAFGSVPYAALARHATKAEGATHDASVEWFLCGVAKNRAYVIEVLVEPAPAPAEAQSVAEFLAKGVTYAGEKRDPKWTEAEVQERWTDDVPKSDEKARQLESTIRTEHYLILTNSSGGKLFAKKMEECYAAIKKVFPFDDVPGQRLMPVFLFQLPDEYYDFCAKQFEEERDEAAKSKGVSYGDFYATWFEAPNDPVHIHEATHQIFANRLYLQGAGSWFQEGVAEYISSRPNERTEIAQLAKKGKHTPLKEFMAIESLLMSAGDDDKSGRSEAGDHYKEAALVIEFLRESKFGKDKFPQWLHAVGNVADNDVESIEAVTKAVYGVDLTGLEKEFVAYCGKR